MDHAGSVFIEDSAACAANRISTAPGGFRVSSETLDQLAARIGLTSIAFLKINIEGAERLAIQGAGQLVSRLGAACICCHDFRAGPAADDWFRTRELVISWLEVNGFQVYTRDDHPRD